MADPGETQVALFPIPDVVAFPGTILPLHVFEPRYRQLIHDCVRTGRLVGVSHTVKTIHRPAKAQTQAQTLSSNQATYKPRDIFSAGQCEVLETTSDGRIIARITMSERLARNKELQTLPYQIVSCRQVLDEQSLTHTEDVTLQNAINARLIELVGAEDPGLARALSDPHWRSIDPGEYSFKIFQFLRFDAEVMQLILESQCANERLQIIWDLVRRD